MGRLIDAEKELKTVEQIQATPEQKDHQFVWEVVKQVLIQAQTVDAETVRHAHPVQTARGIPLTNDTFTEPRCSLCRGRIDDSSAKYCQWCGARMDKEAPHD